MLTPTQILEKMLETLVPFEGAHTEGTIDRALLQVEANRLFRIFRTIEESSGQRFLVTATGQFLDRIGEGMNRPRFPGESDDDYRKRLIFSSDFWNDSTLGGIKTMIKNYYGIDIDNDIYDETRIVELYKQAASFWNKDTEGWIDPSSDFGAEWLGAMNDPGAFEVHLRAFQPGDEKYLKKRQLYDKLMSVRAAGVVVFLYFHLDLTADTMRHPVDRYPEPELISRDMIPTPDIQEVFEVTISEGEITTIVANAVDKSGGIISRRLVHALQKNKCREDFINKYADISEDPYLLAEYEFGSLARRAEPFKFRQSRMRNNCWTFFYNVKYEEETIDRKTKYTYYTRPNPMVDDTHDYRGEDLHGKDFFSVVDFMDFWWRVSTVDGGSISVPCVPKKLTVYKIKDGVTKFWWRVITFDGREISVPSSANLLEIIGNSFAPIAPSTIIGVDNWCIQTDNVDTRQLAASTKDFIILERYNSANKLDWTRRQLAEIKTPTPIEAKPKVLLARLPVGYISLMDRDVSLASGAIQGPVDGDAIRLRFWLSEWINNLFLMLDRIIDSGFDGVMLDGLWAEANWRSENPDAESQMKLVVNQIANYARNIKAKNFIIIARGQEKWASDSKFIEIINGIIGEEVFYAGDERQEASITMDKVNRLSIFKQASKPVMVMDYPSLPITTNNFITQSLAVGFVPYATNRLWSAFSL